jgi:hypothetical protein
MERDKLHLISNVFMGNITLGCRQCVFCELWIERARLKARMVLINEVYSKSPLVARCLADLLGYLLCSLEYWQQTAKYKDVVM